MFQKKMSPDRRSTGSAAEAPPTHEEPMSPTNPTAPAAATTKTPDTGAGTVLAEGSRFNGKANVAGTLRVEGEAEGEIETADSLVVGNTGNVQARVQARRAVVNGRFQGKIAAREGVELQAGSQVEADIKAKNMVMEDGVRFRGNCEIGN